MALRAGIDIGTNTILLLIAEVAHGEIVRVLEDRVHVVRLGEKLNETGMFSKKAMERARNCFREYRALLDQYRPLAVRAAATAGARAASNAISFFQEVQNEFAIPIKIISGEEEAEGSFLGSAEGDDSVAILDIGGGSTELVARNTNGDLEKISYPVGCVRMHERFCSDSPKTEELASLSAHIDTVFAQQGVPELFHEKKWVAVAGTATYLSAIQLGKDRFIPEEIHHSTLTLPQVTALIDRLRTMSSADRLGLGGMDQGRADVIVAGAVILQKFLRQFQKSQTQVSCRGLRYGLVLQA